MTDIEHNVKRMYEEYEYPKYDEKYDITAPYPLKLNITGNPNIINHYIYNGQRKTYDNYKVLFVGVGLGNDLISFCFNFKKYKNLKIVCIDLSKKSISICKKRLQKYNFNNIEIVEMSLLNLTPELFGKFDMINCVGVLHHLENPLLGLKILNNLLEDDGFMDIMMYAKYGRSGVYLMRELLNLINHNVETHDYKTKINNFKEIYHNLPNTNLFKWNEHPCSDHFNSDNGIVDMLLHHQDRAYSIPELYDYFESENLNICCFSVLERYKYNIDLVDTAFNSSRDKYAFNELLFSDINKHSCLVTKKEDTVSSFDNLDNIIVSYLIPYYELNKLVENCKKMIGSFEDQEIIYSNNYISTIENYTDDDNDTSYIQFSSKYKIMFKTNYIITSFLDKINGERTIKEIINLVRTELKLDKTNLELINIFKPIYKIFEMHDLLLLVQYK